MPQHPARDDRAAAGRRSCTDPGPRWTRTRDSVVRGLCEDWEALDRASHLLGCDRPTVGGTVASWGRRHPAVLAGCRTLSDVLDRVRADPDPALLALLTELAAGDELAGRVVVQAMLPKLRTLARRDPDHGVADYVGWLWLRARNYPVTRRVRHVAANLALDTLKSAKRSRPVVEEPWSADGEYGLDWLATEDRQREQMDHHGEIHSLTAARVIRAARTLGLVDARTGGVLESVYVDGLTGSEAAARHGITLTTLRWRCSVTVRRLREHAAELVEAA